MNHYSGINSVVKSVMTAFDDYDYEKPVTHGELEVIITNVLTTYFNSDDFKKSITSDISSRLLKR